MLVECGFTRATLAATGEEFSFTPSLARVAGLADPFGIVRLYADLHGPRAAEAAADVLAGLCDQEDVSALIGSPEPIEGVGVRWVGGAMDAGERVILAQHLMRHGIVGKARPDQQGSGDYSDRFDADQYVAFARAHLGMSAADAEGLSMTEFQALVEAKFPEQAEQKRKVPTREEYEAGMRMIRERHGGK